MASGSSPGGMVLSIMTIPFNHFRVRSGGPFGGAPRAKRSRARAGSDPLGKHLAGRWCRNAKLGILGSIFLGLARALGETMAVTMVIETTPRSPLRCSRRVISIAAVIANEFSEATGQVYQSALIELGLVLFLLHDRQSTGLARLMIVSDYPEGIQEMMAREL